MASNLLPYRPQGYPNIEGGESTYLVNELAKISNAINKLVDAFSTPWTVTTPAPGVSSGVLTAATAIVHEKIIGKMCSVCVQLSVSNVGSGSGILLVTLPTPAAFRTAAAALDDGDSSAVVQGRVIGNALWIMPVTGVIQNHLYLASATYDIG